MKYVARGEFVCYANVQLLVKVLKFMKHTLFLFKIRNRITYIQIQNMFISLFMAEVHFNFITLE